MFIYDDAILEKARATNLTPFNLRFEHQFDEGCRVNDPVHPTGAVAYTRVALERMLTQAGLKLTRPLLKGGWSGYYRDPEDGRMLPSSGQHRHYCLLLSILLLNTNRPCPDH